MKINVIHLPGQEVNSLPIWIARGRTETALQLESRNIKRKQRFLKRVDSLKPKAQWKEPDLSNSDYLYQKFRDDELSLKGDVRDYDCD